jgi:hypothetical protein
MRKMILLAAMAAIAALMLAAAPAFADDNNRHDDGFVFVGDGFCHDFPFAFDCNNRNDFCDFNNCNRNDFCDFFDINNCNRFFHDDGFFRDGVFRDGFNGFNTGGEVEVQDTGNLTISPSQTVTGNQQVNQAAAASAVVKPWWQM